MATVEDNGDHDSIPAAVADLLSRIAHDIRAPLGVVSGTLNELEPDESDGDRAALVTLAHRGLHRLARLADRLSLVARLESGRLELARQPIDLRSVVARAIEAARQIESRRGVRIESSLPEQALIVQVDVDRIVLAISEVIINGIRHASSLVHVEIEVDEETARLIITDDGPGFSPEVLDSCGRRFVLRSSRAGLGIGLSIARDILLAHGGDVRAGPLRSTAGSSSRGGRVQIDISLDG